MLFYGRLASLELATKPHSLIIYHCSSSLFGFLIQKQAPMSSISKTPSSKNMTSESPEESGWTTYFEDFFNNQNIDGHNCSTMSNFSGVGSSSSLVSDAASLAATKLVDAVQGEELSMSKKGNRSSFMKRKKIKKALVDDALEDTASSPVNSPKVLYESQLYKANQKEEIDPFQEKGNASGQRGERKELGLKGRDSDCTELKKKGLCLVPLSMVLKYLG